jgi:hypothetical protein
MLTPPRLVVINETEGLNPNLAQASKGATSKVARTEEHQVPCIVTCQPLKSRGFALSRALHAFG